MCGGGSVTGRIYHKITDKKPFTAGEHELEPLHSLHRLPALIRHPHPSNSHLTVEDTHVFSPTRVNTARFGLYKETLKDG